MAASSSATRERVRSTNIEGAWGVGSRFKLAASPRQASSSALHAEHSARWRPSFRCSSSSSAPAAASASSSRMDSCSFILASRNFRETPRGYLHPADSCQPPLTGRARLHLSLHPVQTAAEARLDRGKRQLEHAGDFLELHLFFKAQRKYLSVDDRQIRQRTGDKPGALLVEQTVERRRTIRGQPRLARLAGRIARGRLVQALRTVAPQMVNGQIPRHRKQPSVEIAAGIKTLDALGDAQPGLLKQIFGQSRLAHQPQQVTIEPVLITR